MAKIKMPRSIINDSTSLVFIANPPRRRWEGPIKIYSQQESLSSAFIKLGGKNGKVTRKLNNQKKRNAQKKYTRMAKLVAAGKLPPEKLDRPYAAHQNHRSHGNCYHLGRAMDRKIDQILETKSVKEE